MSTTTAETQTETTTETATIAATTRLHVGGLGETVTEEELRNRFSNLGTVESVEIIRTKGRSFAYITFIPSSLNSLPKLFNTYNGCAWKGGKLRLEKAKEHYVDRLKREWVEDAELAKGEHISDTDDKIIVAEPKSTQDAESKELRMYFPKLRKFKSLPFRGTGKHKYSFQRVQGPLLPVHFCDCPEHAVLVEIPKDGFHKPGKQDKWINKRDINRRNPVMNRQFDREACSKSGKTKIDNSEIQDDGLNEEEIGIMNSVMKRLFDRGTYSKCEQKDLQDQSDQGVSTSNVVIDKSKMENSTGDDGDIQINIDTEERSRPVTRTRGRQKVLVKDEIDDGADADDDIQINLDAGQNDGSFSKSWNLRENFMKERGMSKRKISDGSFATEKLKIQSRQIKSSSKKRNSQSDEGDEKEQTQPVIKKARGQTQSDKSLEHTENVNSVPEISTAKGVGLRKSAWKDLVGGGNSSFSLSHIISGGKANNEEQPGPKIETSSNDMKNENVNEVVHEKINDLQPKSMKNKRLPAAEPAAQKSLWKDLVDGGDSSFNLSHVRSSGKSDNEERPEPEIGTSSDKIEKVNDVVHDNINGIHPESKDKEGLPSTEPAAPSTDAGVSGRGSAWLKKSSWTQLVAGSSGSFSITQILPEDVLKKQDLHEKNMFSTTVTEPRSSETAFGAPWGSKSSFTSDKIKDAQPSTSKGKEPSEAPSVGGEASKSKASLEPKHASKPYTGVGISESCPFMRSADSLKDWKTAKTALSGKQKKKNDTK